MRLRPRRALRRPAAQVAAVLAVFGLALALWVHGLAGDPGSAQGKAQPGASGSPTPTHPGASPSPSGAAFPGGGPLGGLSGFPFPLSTNFRTVGPGDHTVILKATSDKRLGTVGYQMRGKKGVLKYWVASPMFLSDRVTGIGPLAVLAIQVAPDATTATCTIIIDGVVASTETAKGPWDVTVCVA